MIRERTGKIARLPHPIREQLNLKLAAILAAYPYLEPADIDACLLYASMRVDDEEFVAVPT